MKFVRVAVENGYHVSLPEHYAAAKGLVPLEDEAAVDKRGRPLPASPPNPAADLVAPELAYPPAEPNPSGGDDAAPNTEDKQ